MVASYPVTFLPNFTIILLLFCEKIHVRTRLLNGEGYFKFGARILYLISFTHRNVQSMPSYEI